jgi:hypothetical protein
MPWRSVVAVATDGTPITRGELDAVMRRFPTPTMGTLGSPEPESPRYNLLHQTTGEVCNDTPLTQAEVDQLQDALLERPAGPSPGPLPTRPRHGAAEVVQQWRDQQLVHAQEVQQARRQRVVASQQTLVIQAKRNCSQLSTPLSD